eukprot:Plantae.Rhodophyta-Rhodochaete_pulchella.ctg47714.p2 GENE.Plantae.Rhodophyta-Rhodochaete_pulchella.ctg47714~~Plantae.Rhodophyta-Rhodochaete_pulchella.ctg47714.p2  ORF type:complete len:152 (-),score=17.74 Plantae.Rhodophyta-Rhodochaete_pulchella.ctg47714:662-1117(-)
MPNPNHRVSISYIHSSFGKGVATDYVYLHRIENVHHFLCVKTHFPNGSLARMHRGDEQVQALETHWVQGNFKPKYMKFDQEYNNEVVRKYFADNDIEALPITARRHNKNQSSTTETFGNVTKPWNDVIQIGPKTASPQTLCTRRTSSTETQ